MKAVMGALAGKTVDGKRVNELVRAALVVADANYSPVVSVYSC